MIVTKLQGGHSNQLFQYAMGRALAIRLGVELYMDAEWFGTIAEGDTHRVYELDEYVFEQRFVDRASIALEGTEARRRLFGARKPVLTPYRQQGHGFDRHVLDLPDNSYLEGWWQDERYFRSIRPTLLTELGLRAPPVGRNAELLQQIRETASVSVHVRRGDYVTNPAARTFHGLLDAAYYEAALERLSGLTRTRELHLFVFSDDIDWCRREVELGYPTTFVDVGNSGPEDMRLMRHCKHHVIANSSFSWWGAWLGDDPEKVVVAPRNWFRDAQANAETEIVPRAWVQL